MSVTPSKCFQAWGWSGCACAAVNAHGSLWIAGCPFSSNGLVNAQVRLTNFLNGVTLDPGVLVICPANGLCQPGPYNIQITPALVGAGVRSPYGTRDGAAKAVRAVSNVGGTVQTVPLVDLQDFHAATIQIVYPCIKNVASTCVLVDTNLIQFTGYVTNCGDIRLTNVFVTNVRGGTLLDATTHQPLVPL